MKAKPNVLNLSTKWWPEMRHNEDVESLGTGYDLLEIHSDLENILAINSLFETGG